MSKLPLAAVLCITVFCVAISIAIFYPQLQQQEIEKQNQLKTTTYTGTLDHIQYQQGYYGYRSNTNSKPSVQTCGIIVVPVYPSYSHGYGYNSKVTRTDLYFTDGSVFKIPGYYELTSGLTYRITFTYYIIENGDSIIDNYTKIELLQEGEK